MPPKGMCFANALAIAATIRVAGWLCKWCFGHAITGGAGVRLMPAP